MNIKLIWNGSPLARRKKRFDDAQTFIDYACVEGMEEFVPVAMPYYPGAGKLRDGAEVTEPGHIIYKAEYAEHQYYDALDHSDTGNPKATRVWFETMKRKYAAKILKGAQSVLDTGKMK